MSEWSAFWRRIENHRWGAVDQQILEKVGNAIGWRPNDSLLELGGGRGLHSVRLYRSGRCSETTVVDPSPEAAELAWRNGLNVLPEPPNYKYATVWSSGLVEHFFGDERQGIIDEHFRLASERVVLVVPRKTWLRRLSPPRKEVAPCDLYTVAELHGRMQDAARRYWPCHTITVSTFAPLFGVRHVPDAFYPVLDKLLGWLPDGLILALAERE